MKRLTLLLTCVVLFALPASAISEFHRQWKDHYLVGNNNAVFVKTARKAGCYICHVKEQPKKDARNEYGTALSKYLDADDFQKDWVRANPEEAKRKIVVAFKKVEEELSKDESKYGVKIKNGDLPASDSGL